MAPPSLLEQLRDELPSHHHRRRVYLSADMVEAERIAKAVRELDLKAVRYVMNLVHFELRPGPNDPKRDAFDLMSAALHEVTERLKAAPGVEHSRETSED